METETLLKLSLEVAVPLWIERIKQSGEPWDQMLSRAKHISTILGSTADMVLYRGKKAGESANAFNALAEGIAILSFAPGGVRAFGVHWETKSQRI